MHGLKFLGQALWLATAVLCGSVPAALADNGSAGPATGPAANTLRFSGSPADRPLIEALQAGFQAGHPETRFTNWLHGPESTIAAVYTGIADIAFMAREVREPMERMAFEWALLSRPFSVVIANAGFTEGRPASQLAVLVHPDNPLQSITLGQLDAIFGAEHLRGGANIRAWSESGRSEASQDEAIQVVGPPLDSIEALFFRRRVLLDSRKWNPAYRAMSDWQSIIEFVAAHPASIAFAPAASVGTGVKRLPVATDSDHTPVALERSTVIDGSYPLNRVITLVIHRPDGEPVPALLAEFLRYVLGAAGQAVIEAEGTYLPLSPSRAAKELERLP